MRVTLSNVAIIFATFIILQTYTFPLSGVIRFICVAGILAAFMFRQMSWKPKKHWTYLSCYILFCIWATLSYFWADYRPAVIEQLANMYVAIFSNLLMMLYIVKTQSTYTAFNKWFLPVLLIYLLQSIMVGKFDSQARFSPTGAVNQFGITLTYVYLVALYSFRRYKKNRFFSCLIVLISVSLTLLTGSRKALVNLALFTCMIVLFIKYDHNFLKFAFKILVTLSAGIILLVLVLKVDFLYDRIGYRVSSLFSYLQGNVTEDLSALRRQYMKEDAISLFLENKLLGAGLNNFKYLERYGTYSHSNYYEMLCCLGVVGTFLYYIPIVVISFKAFAHWKKNYDHAIIPLAILLAFIINDFSNISYIYRTIHLFIGLAAGIVYLNEKKHNSLTILVPKIVGPL